MFKIILADDEPIIIKGLKKMIQWERLNAQIVAEAENGEELLAKIRQYSPDIVISDVAMPRMTGLDVIKEIREEGRNTKVIFLSGYQEFDYAKAAIRYAAQEYLLKPVGKEELEQAILKAESSLKSDSPLEYCQEETNDIQSIFRKINTEADCRELYEVFEEMGLETGGKEFTGICFLVPAEFYKKITDHNMAELLRFSIFKRIQEYIRKHKNGFVIKREANSSNIMLIGEPGQGQQMAEQIVEDIINLIDQEYHVRLFCGIGGTVQRMADLKFAYKTAKFSAELHFFVQEEVIRYETISREFHCSFEDYNNKYKELLGSIFHRSTGWQDYLMEELDIIENLHYGNRYAAENRCIALAMDLQQELEEFHILPPEARQQYEMFVAKIRMQEDYAHLRKFIKENLSYFLEKYAFSNKTSDKQTIWQVKEYMKEHYAEDLTLGTLAEIVYMNPYYFSAFFKRETGQNFKNYLMEIRMKAAVQILMESDIKTYELAKAVGYNDVRSFTEKFKEYFGDSPAGYKKSMKS